MTANGTSTQGLSRKHLRTGNDTSRLSGNGKNGRGEDEPNKKIESGVRRKSVPKGRRGGERKRLSGEIAGSVRKQPEAFWP